MSPLPASARTGLPDDGWQPDVLGPGFRARTLGLGEDAEGDVVATLVAYAPKEDEAPKVVSGVGHQPTARPLAGCDVLYVHGWSDYFFQAELARTLAGMGARFFALDLRKYGRSLRAWQTPGYVEDLSTYDDEIGQALRIMDSARTGRRLVLLGHSTGGLTLSLWAARHPGRAAALILNSPWLEFQGSRVGREVLTPLMQAQSRWAPRGELPNVDFGFYWRAVSAAADGEWNFNEDWRPQRGFPVRPAWLKAVLDGHDRVEHGLGLDLPVLTLLSQTSLIQPTWDPRMLECDTVLVVDQIAERATRLGSDVSIRRLNAALHDVFLSRAQVRGQVYAAVGRWAAGVFS